jgi:hypothetical protein
VRQVRCTLHPIFCFSRFSTLLRRSGAASFTQGSFVGVYFYFFGSTLTRARRKWNNDGGKRLNSQYFVFVSCSSNSFFTIRYFDELKSLLPPMQDTKFDKNSILVNSITLIKALRTELAAAQTLRCTGAIGDPSQCKHMPNRRNCVR